jgi:putative Mg2+ transporter-C (MgtC) family protein
VDINTLTADGPYRIVRDPARIAAQVVSGIGFIGGGAVLRYGANIRGLTTAASLWMASSIGMLAGIGDYRLSTIATLLTFLVLFTIGKLERLMFHKHLKSYNRMRLLATVRSSHLMELQGWIEKTFNHEILELKNSVHHESDTIALTYVVNVKGLKLNINELSKKMSSISGVTTSSIKLYLEEIND